MISICYIAFGSNIGSREQNIRNAIRSLEEKCKILNISSLYETEPMYYENQDRFLNGVLKVQTYLTPQELLEFILSTEAKLGRVRTIKNMPRTIDLDILFYGDQVIKEENLIVPHPKIQERGFVLIPLNQIEPDLVHPVLQKTVKELLSELPKEKVVRKISNEMQLK